MTYGELKLQFYFTYADRHGTSHELPASLYFAVIDIANEVGCDLPADPATITEKLFQKDFPDYCIEAVSAVVENRTQALSHPSRKEHRWNYHRNILMPIRKATTR